MEILEQPAAGSAADAAGNIMSPRRARIASARPKRGIMPGLKGVP